MSGGSYTLNSPQENIQAVSIPVPATVANNGKAYKVYWRFESAAGNRNRRMIVDNISIPGVYVSDPSNNCKVLTQVADSDFDGVDDDLLASGVVDYAGYFSIDWVAEDVDIYDDVIEVYVWFAGSSDYTSSASPYYYKVEVTPVTTTTTTTTTTTSATTTNATTTTTTTSATTTNTTTTSTVIATTNIPPSFSTYVF